MDNLVTWRIFAWCATIVWLVANITFLNLPLQGFDFLIFGFVLNVITGGVLLVVRSRYNKFRAELQASQRKAQLNSEDEARRKNDKIGYIQDITVSQDVFDDISSSQTTTRWVNIGSGHARTIRKGRRLRIHSEVNYGTVIHAEVTNTSETDGVILDVLRE